MRLKNDKVDILYDATREFFEKRTKKYNDANPYSVTMLQDKNPEIAIERNIKATEKIIPKLELNINSKVLDVGCGIGRWSDAIKTEIDEYCGTDFCEGMIQIAKERNKELKNRHFYVSENTQIAEKMEENHEGKFSRVILMGTLMYLNDFDVIKTLSAAESVCMPETIICIGESIGKEERLTLKEYWSEELNDIYNAVYRTRNEYAEMFQHTLIDKGFKTVEEGFIYEDRRLNNRDETDQYYFILRR